MTNPTRSDLMRRIRGTDTDPELTLRKALWRRGLRYRLRYRTEAGRPDLVFVGPQVAVYVDGCFWHGCPEHYVSPRTSLGFWRSKLRENVDRDRRQTLSLEKAGWTVVRLWEHEIYVDLEEAVFRVRRAVTAEAQGPADSWRVVSVRTVDGERDMEERHLEDLRDPSRTRTERRVRSTEKW